MGDFQHRLTVVLSLKKKQKKKTLVAVLAWMYCYTEEKYER